MFNVVTSRYPPPPPIHYRFPSPPTKYWTILITFRCLPAPMPPPPPDYAHIIALGINDLILARLAMSRYALGGSGYVDPVPYDLVFETDDSGESVATFEPVIEVIFCIRWYCILCETCFAGHAISSTVAPTPGTAEQTACNREQHGTCLSEPETRSAQR